MKVHRIQKLNDIHSILKMQEKDGKKGSLRWRQASYNENSSTLGLMPSSGDQDYNITDCLFANDPAWKTSKKFCTLKDLKKPES